jgi:hypothetical protein
LKHGSIPEDFAKNCSEFETLRQAREPLSRARRQIVDLLWRCLLWKNQDARETESLREKPCITIARPFSALTDR